MSKSPRLADRLDLRTNSAERISEMDSTDHSQKAEHQSTNRDDLVVNGIVHSASNMEPLALDLQGVTLSTSNTNQPPSMTAPDYIPLECCDYPNDDTSYGDPLSLRPPRTPPPETEPVLCEEQANLVELILNGANVFYTGSAGCGKSTVLKAFVKKLRDRGETVNIIAPTSRAALDTRGATS